MATPLDLVGVGSPIVDTLAFIPEAHLTSVPGGKGGMVLVSDEEMATLRGTLPPGQSEDAAGGSCANAIFVAATLGTKAAILGKLGNDDGAAYYREAFAATGGDLSRFKTGATRNARCLSLVTPDGERTMRTDLGAAMTLAPEEISVTDFNGVRHVHVEGYLLFNRALLEKVLSSAKEAGATVSLDFASYETVAAAKEVLPDWLPRYVDLVFANEDEATTYFGEGQTEEAMAQALTELVPTVVVKVGARGAYVADRAGVVHVPPPTVVKPVDTTGAGDGFAGGFLAAWLQGKALPECARWGALVGAEVVATVGAQVPTARWSEVKTAMGMEV